MKKIRIAVLMYSMDCGGIEKAAVSLLRALPEKEYEISLIMNKKKGSFLKYIPKHVNIQGLNVSENYKKRVEMGDRKWLLYSLAHGKIKQFFLTLDFIIYKFFKSRENATLKRLKQLSKQIYFSKDEFDFVLSFSNIEQLYHAVHYYNSNHIYYWLHCEIDIQRDDYRKYSNLFQRCDKIFGVSQKATDSFYKYLPQFHDHTSTYRNLIDVKLGQEMSKKYIVKRPHKKWWLLTVARLTRQKGIDIIPEIALKLKESGIDFAWSIIGNGPMQTLLKEKAKKYGIEDELLIEGEIDNPYPYFKDCDIYLQPSRYEGYCITVAEARMFCKPIVATDFAGASEQLEDGKCGKIVRFGIDSFADGIIDVINNPELRKRYKDGLAKQKIDTTDTISVLTDFFKSTLKNQDENK